MSKTKRPQRSSSASGLHGWIASLAKSLPDADAVVFIAISVTAIGCTAASGNPEAVAFASLALVVYALFKRDRDKRRCDMESRQQEAEIDLRNAELRQLAQNKKTRPRLAKDKRNLSTK